MATRSGGCLVLVGLGKPEIVMPIVNAAVREVTDLQTVWVMTWHYIIIGWHPRYFPVRQLLPNGNCHGGQWQSWRQAAHHSQVSYWAEQCVLRLLLPQHWGSCCVAPHQSTQGDSWVDICPPGSSSKRPCRHLRLQRPEQGEQSKWWLSVRTSQKTMWGDMMVTDCWQGTHVPAQQSAGFRVH